MTARDYLDVPDWLTVGRKVLETGRFDYSATRIVAKHTPTQVVLDNGNRYRRIEQGATRWSRNSGDAWGHGTSVHPIAGTVAVQTRARVKREKAKAIIAHDYEAWRMSPTADRSKALAALLLTWAEAATEKETL